jgi:hypothetical protein
MRVLVECCLQEKVFNKYYTVLASKLCEHDKNHKFTLQVFLSLHILIKMTLEQNLGENLVNTFFIYLWTNNLFFKFIGYIPFGIR